MSYTDLQRFLADKYNFRTRGIYEGGVNGIRISFHIYNSINEVDQLLESIKVAQKV
jgi:selenocysteine lyase/cysteine desulfurase